MIRDPSKCGTTQGVAKLVSTQDVVKLVSTREVVKLAPTQDVVKTRLAGGPPPRRLPIGTLILGTPSRLRSSLLGVHAPGGCQQLLAVDCF